jgi:hypothetical protein
MKLCWNSSGEGNKLEVSLRLRLIGSSAWTLR